MLRYGLSVVLFAMLAACVAQFRPVSANPYEPSRVTPGGSGGAGPTAAVAVASSVTRRLEGDCYVPCLRGTQCNKESGLCDPLPCRGECKENERCDESGFIPRCVPALEIDLQIETTVKSGPP